METAGAGAIKARGLRFGTALLGGGDDVGKDEDVVFAAEVAGGGGEDCFWADVQLQVARQRHADVVFAEELGDVYGRRERVGGGGWRRRGGGDCGSCYG